MKHKRVIISITNPEIYSVGCAESLDGKMGVVTEYNEMMNKYLVEFDAPADKWWSNQTPCIEFWFSESSIIETGGI